MKLPSTHKPSIPHVPCPTCGANKTKVVYGQPDLQGTRRLRQCKTCQGRFYTRQVGDSGEMIEGAVKIVASPAFEPDEPEALESAEIEPGDESGEDLSKPRKRGWRVRLMFLEIKHGLTRCGGEIDREELAALYQGWT